VKHTNVKWTTLILVLGAVMMLGACKKKVAPPPPPAPPPAAAPTASLSANPNTVEKGQPVTLKVFDAPLIVIVRSRMPSSVAMGMCLPS